MKINQGNLEYSLIQKRKVLLSSGIHWNDDKIAALDYALFVVVQSQSRLEILQFNFVKHTEMQRKDKEHDTNRV
jgi:hypothetical protein